MLKKIKSLFIVEEEGDAAKTPKGEATVKAKNPTPTTTTSTAPTSRSSSSGTATKKFTNVLLKALEENNLEGFDYMEYKKSLESLKKMSMDEATRFQSAFAMAQTMGVSAPKLIQSTQHYLQVLNSEQQKFQQAVANQKSSGIKQKEQEIVNLDKTIKNKQEQIKKLTAEIEHHQKTMEKMKGEITNEASKIESTKANFMASYQLLMSQIQDDFEKMKKYLK